MTEFLIYPPIIQEEDDKAPIPWLSMLTCVPLWAILITQCGQSWAFYTQLTELPSYMSQILHFDITQVSFRSLFVCIFH